MAPRIYLDNNATTRPDPRVLAELRPIQESIWANPASGHQAGREAAAKLSEARRRVGAQLGVSPASIVFTAGGSEGDQLAIFGIMTSASEADAHLLTSAVEHPAVREAARALAESGSYSNSFDWEELPVDGQGRLNLDQLRAAIRPGKTRLVSIMAANNETGVIFPIEAIHRICREADVLLHVDAVQAVGKIPLPAAHCDLMSLSAHKFHGLRNSGVLMVRPGISLRALTPGGGQERGRRGVTVDVAAAIGVAAALEFAEVGREAAAERMANLRDRLQRELEGSISGLQVSGAEAERLPNTLHLLIEGVEAEALLLALDREGIAVSAGSACSTGALQPSHVLEAMSLAREKMHGALRISLSRENTEEEIERVATLLPELVSHLRSLTARREVR